MNNLKVIFSLNLALVTFAGCGGESQGGSTGVVSTGLSVSKPLSDVTTAEATQGCGHMKDAIEARFQQPSAKTGLCTLLAASFSNTESACTSVRDSCVKGDTGSAGTSSDTSLASLDPATGLDCTGTNLDSWQGCSATVGELESCLNDTLDAIFTLLNTYSCKDVSTANTDPSVDCSPPPLDPQGNVAIDPQTGKPYPDHRADCNASSATLSPPTPASCQALQTKCPNLALFGN